jgi:hypothetical protein
METPVSRHAILDPGTAEFYRSTIRTLTEAGVPFLVGGAYAFARYTGIERHTKDFDVFMRREDYPRALDVLNGTGCHTDLTFPHWLAKAHCDDDFVDIIFSSGNGVADIDDEWFLHAVPSEVLGLPVHLCPAEEMIWQKAFLMERERFDGADVAHLLRARAVDLDWPRLLRRFGQHWPVLLSHLILYGYIYPNDQQLIPAGVLRDLLRRAEFAHSQPPGDARLCRGTILSRVQYLTDVEQWGYRDGRLIPAGPMTDADAESWTAAAENPPLVHRNGAGPSADDALENP